MQVGSLIFVVIVATWAAYLLQHWIRRREDAAASDSVERFSEAMRVLQKRAPAPALATPESPFVARRVTPTAHRTTAEVAPMSSSPAPGPHRADRADRRQPRPAPAPVPVVSRWRRQLRGVLLLLSLLWVPTSVVLAVLHILLGICVPLAVLTLAAVVVWLRLEVRADRARAERLRHESSGRARMADAGPQRPAPSPQGRRRARPLTSDDTQVIHAPVPGGDEPAVTAVRPSAPAEPAPAMAAAVSGHPARLEHPAEPERSVRREARSAAYDFAAELAREAAAHAPAPQPVEEGTWQPVPVPPPTYTMKAKAEPRMTAAGIPADVFATPEFAEEAEELDERGLFARRAANL